MKQKLLKKHHIADTFAVLAVFLLLAGIMAAPRMTIAAAGTKLYVSPASQSVVSGGNVVASVVIDTGGESVNTVQTVFTYDASKFNFVSIAPGSAFSSAFPNSNSSGSVQFSAGSTGGVSGVQTVATVTLYAKAGGTSAINLAAVCPPGNYASTCSAAYHSVTSENVLSTVNGGSYAVSGGSTPAPAPSPAPSPPPPSPAPGPGSPATSSAKPSTAQPATTANSPAATATSKPVPVISGLAITNVTETSATIKWQTNIPATSIVQFGLNDKFGQTARTEGMSTAHEVTLKAPYLAQGSKYYVQALSASADGASASSEPQTFTTTGFTVTLRIVDTNGQSIAGAKVICGTETKTADSNGSVICQNMLAGPQKVTIKAGNATTTRTITVGKLDPATGNYETQKFSLTAEKGSILSPYVIAGLGLLLLAVTSLFMPNSPIRRLLQGHNPGPGSGPGIVGGSSGSSPPVVPPVSGPNPGNPSLFSTPAIVPNDPELPAQIIRPDAAPLTEKINQEIIK